MDAGFYFIFISRDFILKLHRPADAIQALKQAFLIKSIDLKGIGLPARSYCLRRQISADGGPFIFLNEGEYLVYFLGF